MQTPFVIDLIVAMRMLVEIIGCVLLGQGLLFVLAGRRREQNFVYQLLAAVSRPAIKVTRFIVPKFLVRDEHVGLVAVLLLFWLWFVLAWLKRYACAVHGLQC